VVVGTVSAATAGVIPHTACPPGRLQVMAQAAPSAILSCISLAGTERVLLPCYLLRRIWRLSIPGQSRGPIPTSSCRHDCIRGLTCQEKRSFPVHHYDFPASERAFIRRASAPIVASQDRSNSIEGKGNDAENAPEKSEAHTTSLVLQDGSEFGLTEYWLVGDELSYVTTYGGRNSLPVQRIDLEKTLKLNAERGVKFVLRPKPAQPR